MHNFHSQSRAFLSLPSLKEHADLIIHTIKRAAHDTPRRERGASSCKVKSQIDVRISMSTLSRGGHRGQSKNEAVQERHG